MTNKEKYKMAFSALQPSERLSWEAERMIRLQKQKKMKLAAAIVSGCILVGGTGTAYATNVGGIQRERVPGHKGRGGAGGVGCAPDG